MARRIYTEKFNKLYRAYKRAYTAKKRQLRKLNRRYGVDSFTMREKRRSKSDFKDILENYLSEIPEDKKNRNQIAVRRIVADEAYKRSREQYLGLVRKREEILRETGYEVPKMTEFEFRTGAKGIDYEVLSSHYHTLRSLGMDSYEARDEISLLFYDSEPDTKGWK